MIQKQKETKSALSRRLGISRASLYYVSKKIKKDWILKNQIEVVLKEHPSYGSPRIALSLKINRKRIVRVMGLFGLKAYRRRGRKPRKTGVSNLIFPNLLKNRFPGRINDIWVADFTYIPYKDKFIYLSTVMDLFSREIVGFSVMNNHSVSLVLQSLFSALNYHKRPNIFHSDNGKEYGSKIFLRTLNDLGILVSRSAKSSPWENGYQESFYSQFKIDLGDPNRFDSLGELVYEIYRLIYDYNHKRIHSVLKMPPLLFIERYQKLVEKVS